VGVALGAGFSVGVFVMVGVLEGSREAVAKGMGVSDGSREGVGLASGWVDEVNAGCGLICPAHEALVKARINQTFINSQSE